MAGTAEEPRRGVRRNHDATARMANDEQDSSGSDYFSGLKLEATTYRLRSGLAT